MKKKDFNGKNNFNCNIDVLLHISSEQKVVTEILFKIKFHDKTSNSRLEFICMKTYYSK